jgi:hypothetical protein
VKFLQWVADFSQKEEDVVGAKSDSLKIIFSNNYAFSCQYKYAGGAIVWGAPGTFI